MAQGPTPKRFVTPRLLHDGAQPGPPLAQPLRFGQQDVKGEVHPGSGSGGTPPRFDAVLEVRGEEASGPPLFHGGFAHGPPRARFLYLSWKREGAHAYMWGWRIKIPLSGIGWGDIRAAAGCAIIAGITGRRPHASAPIAWRIEPPR